MPDQGRDPVRLDDIGPRPLCIVTRDPILRAQFVTALQTLLRSHDEFGIIQDRRRDRASMEAKPDVADQPFVDRRGNSHVDRLLKMDGFAIVPAPATGKRSRISFLPSAAPSEGLSHADDDADEREPRKDVRRFNRLRTLWFVSWLILVGLLSASAALFLFSPTAPPSANQPPSADRINAAPAVEQAPPVTAPSPGTGRTLPNVQAPPLPAVAVSKSPDPARPLRAGTSPRAVPEPSTSVPRSANVQPPPAASHEVLPPQFVGLPRVELMRSPAPSAGGENAAYAVRISDPAGQPLAGANVVLLTRLADGTVENIPLDPGPEPGTYTGTAPLTRSAPVDLRIRVTTSDQRVELPLAR